ncbi:MAG: RNA polymerase sigma-70 factor [Prevotellaceae bacterium]|nr:RNA polymerase sigma-70 factor [Prevotellaceae bacterium]
MINIEDIQTEQFKSDNHAIYKQLFTTWYEPLCYYAFSILHNMDESEDIVQKMFCKLWDQRKETNIKTSIKSYLYRTVHNSCINKLKQTKIRAEHNQLYTYSKSEAVINSDNNVEYSELQQQISRAIEKLPPKCREVFELSRLQQLSYAEIAEKLDISFNTVENHIAKALKLLRIDLKEFLAILLIFAVLK